MNKNVTVAATPLTCGRRLQTNNGYDKKYNASIQDGDCHPFIFLRGMTA